MRTADVVRVISPLIKKCLADAGLSVILLKGYQPIQQGIPVDAALFYHMIPANIDSWQGSYDKYNDVNDNFTTTKSTQESYIMQLTCRSLVDDDDTDPLYADDILRILRDRMSPVSINRELKKGGVGLYVPSKLTPSTQQNDAGQWEQMPILELGLSFVSSYNDVTERVKSVESIIQEV